MVPLRKAHVGQGRSHKGTARHWSSMEGTVCTGPGETRAGSDPLGMIAVYSPGMHIVPGIRSRGMFWSAQDRGMYIVPRYVRSRRNIRARGHLDGTFAPRILGLVRAEDSGSGTCVCAATLPHFIIIITSLLHIVCGGFCRACVGNTFTSNLSLTSIKVNYKQVFIIVVFGSCDLDSLAAVGRRASSTRPPKSPNLLVVKEELLRGRRAACASLHLRGSCPPRSGSPRFCPRACTAPES